MDRYSLIETKLKREFVLLQGLGCRWRRCAFCNYHEDVSESPYEINKEVLSHVTGVHGVLDVINSGSAMELDGQTLALIKRIVLEKNIHTLWFEAHFMYRNRLAAFAEQFYPAEVKFRCGIESFEPSCRNAWNKGVPSWVTPADVAKHFKGVCLLCCTVGDTPERILSDIYKASEFFEYFSVNVFCDNGTAVKRDESLVRWFIDELYPKIKDNPKIDILIDNTDLGVG